MKTYVVLILVIIISSCTYMAKKKYHAAKDYLDNAINRELETHERSDTILLDFRFGMSEKEVKLHLNKLIRQGEIHTNTRGGTPIMDVQFDNRSSFFSEASGIILFQYHNYSLYELRVYFNWTESPDSYSELLSVQLASLIQQGVGRKWDLWPIRYEIPQLIEPKLNDTYFIHKNQLIRISPDLEYVIVTYTDIYADNQKKEDEKKESLEEYNKSIEKF